MAFERAGERREGQDAKYHLIPTTRSCVNGNITTLEDGREGVTRQRLGLSSFMKVYLVVLHIVIVILACTLFLPDRLESLRGHGLPSDGKTWSPAQEHITYTTVSNAGSFTQSYDKGNQPSAFSGPPTPEQDKAWDELLKPMFFAATQEEMARAGETFEANNTTEIVGGDGDEYLAALGVYHELHCLGKIRHQLFRHDPTTNSSRRGSPTGSEMKTFNEKDEVFRRNHLYHCIDTIRESLMCQANTAMLSFQWSSDIRNKAFPKTNSRSVCVDWHSIEQWSLGRMVDANHLPVNWPFPSKQPGLK